MPETSHEKTLTWGEHSQYAHSCSTSLQAGAIIAHQLGKPQLARRLTTLSVGVASISAGMAILETSAILGPVGIGLGAIVCGLGLFGGDEEPDNRLGEYLNTCFSQVLDELSIIRQDIAQLDVNAQERFRVTCEMIASFQNLFVQSHQQMIQAFTVLNEHVHTVRSEAAGYHRDLTEQHGEQNLQHYVSKIKSKVSGFRALKSNFDSRVTSATRNGESVTKAIHKIFIQIYDEIYPLAMGDEVSEERLPPLKTLPQALVYLQQEDSQLIDVSWLFNRVNDYLGREIRQDESIPYYPISLPNEMRLINRAILTESAKLLCHVLETRYQSASIPTEALALTQHMHQRFLEPYLTLLAQIQKNETLRHLFTLYLGVIDFHFLKKIEHEIKSFENKRTNHAKNQLEKNIKKIGEEEHQLLERLNRQELACYQVMSFHEAIYQYIIKLQNDRNIPTNHSFVLRYTHSIFSHVSFPPDYQFHSQSQEYDSAELKHNIALHHQEMCKKAFELQDAHQQAMLNYSHFSFFSTSDQALPILSYSIMYPDIKTQEKVSIHFRVPLFLVEKIPNEVRSLIFSGICSLQWIYSIDDADDKIMHVTASLISDDKLSEDAAVILHADIVNPLIDFHKNAFPYGRSYSIQESWLLFFHGGYYSRQTGMILLNTGGPQIRLRNAQANFPYIPTQAYDAFINSSDGTFEGQPCLHVTSKMASQDQEKLKDYWHSTYASFQQELTASFSPKGRNEQALMLANDIFHTLIALIEFIQPENYEAYVIQLKMLHDQVLQAVHLGIESLSEIEKTYQQVEQIAQTIDSKPHMNNTLVHTAETLSAFFHRWKNHQDAFSVYAEEKTTTPLILQLQKNIDRLEKAIIKMQANSESSLIEKADDLYARGRASFLCHEVREAISFFGNARTQYKRALSEEGLDIRIKNKIEKRIAKTSHDGKYSSARLI